MNTCKQCGIDLVIGTICPGCCQAFQEDLIAATQKIYELNHAADRAEQRNRELTRQMEQLRARVDVAEKALQKLRDADEFAQETGIGRPLPATLRMWIDDALTAPPSSSDLGRADTGREETP